MTKLEFDIQTALLQLKGKIAKATFDSRRRYFNQLVAMANTMHITEPCQRLYDAFIADDHGSPERHSQHKRCVRLLDKVAATNANDEKGMFFTERLMPTKQEIQEFFRDKVFPFYGEIPLNYLIIKAEIEMEYLHLSESTMGQYRHCWNIINCYCFKLGTVSFDKGILDRFLSDITEHYHIGTMKRWKWKTYRKAIHILCEVAETGVFHWRHISKQTTLMKNPEFEKIRFEYRVFLTCKNLQKNTVELYDYVFRQAIKYFRVTTVEGLFSLKPEDIRYVISGFAAICNNESMTTILPILRSILKELHSRGWIENDISGAVISGYIRKRSVSAYILPEDEKHLVEQLDNESKRNKAIILLALRLGLRDCDITRLTFDEIDWVNDRIIIDQKKTGNPLKLPLLPEVGNALMDYIENERPKHKDRYRYIFLREQAPYNKLSSVYQICSRLLLKLGITPVNGNKKGVHLFRYSLVHKLLKAKVPHQVITETLGHTSKESDKPYLSMEESMLRQCALDLSIIGSISWEVKA